MKQLAGAGLHKATYTPMQHAVIAFRLYLRLQGEASFRQAVGLQGCVQERH